MNQSPVVCDQPGPVTAGGGADFNINRPCCGVTRLNQKRFVLYRRFHKKTARPRFDISTLWDQSPLVFLNSFVFTYILIFVSSDVSVIES
jgi:hypothetical protein